MADFTALIASLEVAVPMAIESVRSWDPDRRIAYCRDHADLVASQSDELMFGHKKGGPAKLFATLARALACLSFQPGGVRFAGCHWETSEVVQ